MRIDLRLCAALATIVALALAACQTRATEPTTSLVTAEPMGSIVTGNEGSSETTEPATTGTEEPSWTATPPALSKSTDSPATATSTPTWTATPGSDETVTVRFSLEDAEREVLSWFDRRRNARIEWSGYVRRGEVAGAFEYLVNKWPEGSEWTYVDLQRSESYSEFVGDPVAAVVVSARGIDPLIIDGEAYVPDHGQDLAVAPERYGVVAMFDAVSGQRQVVMEGSTSAFAGIPTARVSHDTGSTVTAPTSATAEPPARPLATETAPALVTEVAARREGLPQPPVPGARRLTLSNMPDSLRPTFRFYPLAPGSSRTWEWSSESGGVVWSAALVTETVEAAWLDGEVAIVESRLEWQWQTGPWEHYLEAPARFVRYVGPRFIARAPFDVSNEESPFSTENSSYRWPTPMPGSPFALESIAIEAYSGLFPEQWDGGVYQGAAGPVTVTTPAGPFEGCWGLTYMIAATAGTRRWVCPGLGVVAFGGGHAAGFHASMTVAQLVRWTRAALPVE